MAPNGFKSKELIEDSDIESDTTSSSSDATSTSNDKQKQHAQPANNADSSTSDSSEESSDDSDSESESTSGSESSSQSKKRKTNSTPAQPTPNKRAKTVTVNDTPSRAQASQEKTKSKQRPYHPPAGFTTVKPGDAMDTDTSRFSKETLEGKELWHITAPSSVSIKDLQTVDLDATRKGKKIMSSNGLDYGLFSVPAYSPKDQRLLIADPAGGKYTSLSKPVSKTFNLQRILPEIPLPPSLDQMPPLIMTKPIVQQPAGLKTQHYPSGFEPKTRDVFQVPASPPGFSSHPPTSEKKKRKKQDASERAEPVNTPSRTDKTKEKKKRDKKQNLSMDP